ncbi:MAG: isoprenylcysteine carboxylmethyltransferase family protein [Myxococcales bacterium]|nr:isoprenylcysteine carboxylmethyltransferase family protein [Myxococcales bacterium]
MDLSLQSAPYLHIGFAFLHIALGEGLSAWVYRRRYGRSPLVLYTAADSPHRRVSRRIAWAGLAWALALFVPALRPGYARSLLAPLGEFPPGLSWGLAAAGMLFMVTAQLRMGEAFRVGQDAAWAPAGLVTEGLHGLSRNPIYLGSMASLLGMSLWLPSLAVLGAWGVLAWQIDQLVGCEEAFLAGRFPEAWARYAGEVPRYVGWRGYRERGGRS